MKEAKKEEIIESGNEEERDEEEEAEKEQNDQIQIGRKIEETERQQKTKVSGEEEGVEEVVQQPQTTTEKPADATQPTAEPAKIQGKLDNNGNANGSANRYHRGKNQTLYILKIFWIGWGCGIIYQLFIKIFPCLYLSLLWI